MTTREQSLYDEKESLMDHQNVVDEISDDSLSKWPPSGQQKMSLRQGLYTSFNGALTTWATIAGAK